MSTPAIAVLRVSTTGQDEENQLPDIQRYAAANGYDIIKVIPIHGRSAFHGRHLPLLYAAVDEHVVNGPAEAVLFWKMDRFTREGAERAYALRRHVRDAGARLLFATQEFLNGDDMAASMAYTAIAELAKEDSRTKSDRIKADHAKLRARGARTGTIPWGYLPVTVEGVKKLALDASLAPVVEQIFKRVAAGDTLNTVAEWLTADGVAPSTRGVKDGGTGGWYPRTVGSIIRNATYAGRHANGGGTTLSCPPAVSAQLYADANDSLNRRPKRGAPRADGPALLSGLLTCPRCGGESPMYRIGARGAFSYRCTGRGPVATRKGCGNMVRLAAADALADAAMRRLTVTRKVYTRKVDDTQERIAALRADIRSLDDLDPCYDERHAAMRAELRALRDAEGKGGGWVIEETDQTYADAWAATDPDERNAVLRSWGIRFYAVAAKHAECLPAFTAALGARVLATDGKGWDAADGDGLTVVCVYGALG